MSGRLHLPVILFFAALLALGLAVHRDYGISWDEPHERYTGTSPSNISPSASRLPW